MKRSSNTSLLIGLALLLVILVVNAGLSYRNVQQLEEDGRRVAHVRDVLIRVDEILIALDDAESSARGFMLSGNEDALKPYQQAADRMPILLALLHGEAGASQEIKTQIASLDESAQRQLESLNQTIELRRRGGADAPSPDADDESAMEAIRRDVANIKDVENALLADRRQQRISTYNQAIATGIVTAVLALLAVVALAWVVVRNLEARQRAAALLHEQRELLRTTLVSIGDGVIATDTQGRITFLNAIAESLTGWSQEGASGKHLDQVFNIVHEQSRERVENPAAKVLASGTRIGLANHTVLLGRDGSERPIDDSAAPILDEDGGVLGVVLVFRDVTERKRLEALQHEGARRLRLVLDSVPQKIFTAKPDGAVDYFNPSWTRYSGMRMDELLGWNWAQVVHADDIDENLRVWKQSITTGQPVELNHRLRSADGEYRWHVSRAVAITDADGVVSAWVGANNDIHAEKTLANELRAVASDLSEADRRKNEFLAILAHELRNPMAPVRNSAQVLRASGEAIQRASLLMERQIGQMVRLVDDLLDVSRISRGKIELRKSRVELITVLKDAIDAAKTQFADAGVALVVALPADPLWLDADPARLAQIIGNLLSNACKFTDRDGRVSIRIERDNAQAVIRVEDSGIGIAADQLPHIFEMFTQIDTALERSEGGLGIGLALVRNLTELHGGSVEAASAGAGRGATFTVRLPIVSESLAMPAATVASAAAVAGRSILIVDDNLDSAESLEMLLKMSGNATHMAHDGLQAIEVAAAFLPDIILLDIGLPKLNGYEVAEEIRRAPWGRNIVLIALTGWGQDSDRQRSGAAGFDAHMVKPIAYDDLMKLLDRFPSPLRAPAA